MIHYNPTVSGSLVVTGSLIVTQTISGTITASYIDYNSVANKPAIVSSSTQIISLLPNGVLSSSAQVSTSLPIGVISSSLQLTSSYDDRYILSGSITETTWNNIASKPVGIVSGSEQIVGILSALNTYTGSNDTTNTTQNTKLSRIEESTSSLNSYTSSNDTLNTLQTTRIDQLAASTASINSYTSSNDTTNTTQNNRLSRIEESTSSLNSYTSSLKTAIALTGSSLTVLGNFRVDGNTTTIGGNLVVQGTTTTVSASNLTVENNLIYLNDGGEGVNLDLGWAGNYNDGTYAHAGMFRDASDGVFRAFKGYVPEPSQSIDIADPTFQLADFEAANLIGVIKSKNGVVSGSSQVVGILSSLNTYTGSNDTLNTLQTTRIDQLAAATASINSYTASNDTTNTAQNSRLTNIEAATGSYETKGRGIVSGSSQITYTGISSIPGGIVSGSSQITLSSTTGFGTYINQAVLSTSSPTFASVTGTITPSGNGDSNAPFKFSQDYSGWMSIVAGTPGSANGWGLYWAGESGTLYGTNQAGAVGNIWSNSSNPNEYVFVGNGVSVFSVYGNSGHWWSKGNGRVGGTLTVDSTATVNSSAVRTDATTSYSTTFTSVSSVSVTHNLGTKNVMVMCYGSDDEMFWPATIKTTSTTVVDITFTTARTGRVVVIR